MKKIMCFIGLVSICNFFIFGNVYAQHDVATPASRGADQSFRASTKEHEKAVAKQDKRGVTFDMADVAESKADIAAQKASEAKVKAKSSAAAADRAAAKTKTEKSSASATAERGGTREQATGAGGHSEATADICKQKPELPRCLVNGGTK